MCALSRDIEGLNRQLAWYGCLFSGLVGNVNPEYFAVIGYPL
jgi:hypothetical protein